MKKCKDRLQTWKHKHFLCCGCSHFDKCKEFVGKQTELELLK